jgi:DNA-binding transcriptional regulator YiaG
MAAALRFTANESRKKNLDCKGLPFRETLTKPFSWEAAITPKQYADAIDRLGLSQRAAGRFLGVEERTSRRWISGESAVPESVAKLLRLMIARKINPDDVK